MLNKCKEMVAGSLTWLSKDGGQDSDGSYFKSSCLKHK